ncbi:hypothetical protein ACFLZN_02055 [Nanoarchaeota archaeon]
MATCFPRRQNSSKCDQDRDKIFEYFQDEEYITKCKFGFDIIHRDICAESVKKLVESADPLTAIVLERRSTGPLNIFADLRDFNRGTFFRRILDWNDPESVEQVSYAVKEFSKEFYRDFKIAVERRDTERASKVFARITLDDMKTKDAAREFIREYPKSARNGMLYYIKTQFLFKSDWGRDLFKTAVGILVSPDKPYEDMMLQILSWGETYSSCFVDYLVLSCRVNGIPLSGAYQETRERLPFRGMAHFDSFFYEVCSPLCVTNLNGQLLEVIQKTPGFMMSGRGHEKALQEFPVVKPCIDAYRREISKLIELRKKRPGFIAEQEKIGELEEQVEELKTRDSHREDALRRISDVLQKSDEGDIAGSNLSRYLENLRKKKAKSDLKDSGTDSGKDTGKDSGSEDFT